MWIPYDVRASLKGESDRETLRLSRADEQRREFLVGFFLRNPVTQAWELDLIAEEGLPELPARLPDAAFTVCPNDAGKLAEVIYRLSATSAIEALNLAHDDLQPRLLAWLAQVGRGMAIAGWRVADMTHDARWRCTPFRPSAMRVDYGMAPVDADLMPVVELFQRARNAPDAAMRLLAAFAVLSAAMTHPAMKRSGADTLRISQDMLIHSGAMALPNGLMDMPLQNLMDLLRPEHDRLVGRDAILVPVSTDLAAQKRLALLANLADLVAHRLILAELAARSHGVEPASALAVEG